MKRPVYIYIYLYIHGQYAAVTAENDPDGLQQLAVASCNYTRTCVCKQPSALIKELRGMYHSVGIGALTSANNLNGVNIQ